MKRFVAIIRQILVFSRLSNLAKKESFEGIDPESVIGVLESLGHIHPLLADKINIIKEPFRYTRSSLRGYTPCEEALMRIWELALKQYSAEESTKRRWLEVMSMCNAFYEELVRPQEVSALARAA